MKITVQILYNGKPYRPELLKNDIMASAVDKVKQKLEPFAEEVAAQGGQITIKIVTADDGQPALSVDYGDVSPELENRINSTFPKEEK